MSKYIRFDNMTWPSPDKEFTPDSNEGSCEWKLRYNPSSLTDFERYYICDIISAYNNLIYLNVKQRQKIIKEIKKAMKDQYEEKT